MAPAAIAFSSDSLVMSCDGVTPRSRTSTTSRPQSSATWPFLPSSAGTIELPAGEMPSTSNAIAMVFAVNWPPQAPAPGLAWFSRSRRSSSERSPAACAPMPSNTSWMVTSLPRQRPGAIEPPYSIRLGTSPSRASAITQPGIVLSQPDSAITASNMCPRATSSIESAITSRLTSEARIPSVPIVMPSEIATVLNSMGVPPAARTPSFTRSASRRRWKLQGIVSVQVFAMPTIGRCSASSSKPIPFR